MNKRMLILTAFLIGILVLSGCSVSTDGNTVANTDTIKVGAYLPLTGEGASWGQNALAGITLALDEINSQGGINGQEIELIVEDDLCTSESVNAVQKLINVDGVSALLGPVCSSAAGPAVPIIQQEQIPNVLIGASAPDLTATGDYIFRVYPSDAFQGKEAAKYIYENMGARKVAVVYVKNDWGQGIKEVFVEEFENYGGEIVYSSGVLQTETDFKTEIGKIEDSEADLLYFPVYPTNAIAAFKQMEELEFEIPIVGGDSLSGEEVVSSGYGDGAIYLVPEIGGAEEIADSIKALDGFEDLEVNFIAPLAYDASMVLFDAIKIAGDDPTAIKEALRVTSYVGAMGSLIEFDDMGDISYSEYSVYIIRNGESAIYHG